ncbi:MAG: hypothetical protein NTV34_06955, partial [Proteobacteria bacterium]|nr:hypothetical protein [Pseudomonadota bacterium]
FEGRELAGQGSLRHSQGFSTPIGRWKGAPDGPPERSTDSALAALGLSVGARGKLEFVNGFKVEGQLTRVVRDKGIILYVTWSDCRVMRGTQCYFEPSWGEFDMAVADTMISAYGGPGDRQAYGEYEMGGVSTQPGRTSPFTPEEIGQFACYSKIRQFRGAGPLKVEDSLTSVAADVTAHYQDEWLLNLELLESLKSGGLPAEMEHILTERLEKVAKRSDPSMATLIQKGVNIAATSD